MLLNVWATWCEPCRDEMPSIEKLHREFGPQGLAVVAISVDDPGAEQRDPRLREGARAHLRDPARSRAGHDAQTTRSPGIPETFVIARDGTIRKK